MKRRSYPRPKGKSRTFLKRTPPLGRKRAGKANLAERGEGVTSMSQKRVLAHRKKLKRKWRTALRLVKERTMEQKTSKKTVRGEKGTVRLRHARNAGLFIGGGQRKRQAVSSLLKSTERTNPKKGTMPGGGAPSPVE